MIDLKYFIFIKEANDYNIFILSNYIIFIYKSNILFYFHTYFLFKESYKLTWLNAFNTVRC
jgi:hypothetical protein